MVRCHSQVFEIGANDCSGRAYYLGGRVAFGVSTGSLRWVVAPVTVGKAPSIGRRHLGAEMGPGIVALEIQPWLLPRIHSYRFGLQELGVTQVGFGASGGVDISVARGPWSACGSGLGHFWSGGIFWSSRSSKKAVVDRILSPLCVCHTGF